MGVRVLVAGASVMTALAAGAGAYAVQLDHRLSSAQAMASTLERTSAASITKQQEAEAAVRSATTKAAARAASDAIKIRTLEGKVADLSGQIGDLRGSLETATRPVTVVQAPGVQRTQIEALAYCRTLATQAFPSDTNPRTDPTLSGLGDAYTEMMRHRTEGQCMGEQGYPLSP